MAQILQRHGEAALQHIRALPCAAGSVIQFSHRLLHWGSAAESGPSRAWRTEQEPPRIALSFAATDARFEKPFLAHASAMPPLPTRTALVASLGLLYQQSNPLTPYRRGLYWDVVRSNEQSFEEKYFAMIRRNAASADAAESQASGMYGMGAAAPSSAAVVTPPPGKVDDDGSYLMFTGEKLAAKLAQLSRLHSEGTLTDTQYAKAQKDVAVARLMDPGFAKFPGME